MRRVTISTLSVFPSVFVFAGEALAHNGHGAAFAHLHWWEYALLAVAIVAAAIYFVKR